MQNKVTTRFINSHDVLKSSGVIRSTRQFALSLDTHPQSINDILKGRRDATVEMVMNLSLQYDISTDYLLKGSGEIFASSSQKIEQQDNIVYVPYAAHAGFGDQFFESTTYEENMKFSIPGYSPNKGEHRCFDVAGDSMEPTLFSNDKIICSKISSSHLYNAVRDNYVYVVITAHEILVKRVVNKLKGTGELLLKSDNKGYKDIIIDGNDIREIWIVNMKISYFMPDPKNVKNAFHDEIDQLKSIIEVQSNSILTLNKSIESLLRNSRR